MYYYVIYVYSKEVSDVSRSLANESKRYKWGAKQLSVTVMLIVYYTVYVMCIYML